MCGGITTSHIPAIGNAISRGLQDEPYWKPFFDGYRPVRAWLGKVNPDVAAPRPYVGKGDPVAIVRTQNTFPATEASGPPFAVGQFVAGDTRPLATASLAARRLPARIRPALVAGARVQR